MNITCLTWNRSHDQLAFSLRDGSITVINRVTARSVGRLETFARDVYRETGSHTECGHTRQLFFDDSGKLLLVYGDRKTQVLTLPGGQVTAESETPGGETSQWRQHPSRSNLLLNIRIERVSVFTWKLHEEQSNPLNYMSELSESLTIDATYQSYHSRLLLLRTRKLEFSRVHHSFMLLPTTASGRKALQRVRLPSHPSSSPKGSPKQLRIP